MPLLHDPAVRKTMEARLTAIRPDSQRQWGSMSVDQMLWHVNQFLAFASKLQAKHLDHHFRQFGA